MVVLVRPLRNGRARVKELKPRAGLAPRWPGPAAASSLIGEGGPALREGGRSGRLASGDLWMVTVALTGRAIGWNSRAPWQDGSVHQYARRTIDLQSSRGSQGVSPWPHTARCRPFS